MIWWPIIIQPIMTATPRNFMCQFYRLLFYHLSHHNSFSKKSYLIFYMSITIEISNSKWCRVEESFIKKSHYRINRNLKSFLCYFAQMQDEKERYTYVDCKRYNKLTDQVTDWIIIIINLLHCGWAVEWWCRKTI